jgi:asparagine synthase (glutamine-hydrolysing)
MFRYIGLVWNPQDQAAEHAARVLRFRLQSSSDHWDCVLAAAGSQIFVTGCTPASGPIPLHGHPGIVLGTLFKRPPDSTAAAPQRVRSLDERLSGQVHDSAGRALCERYWGRYVAFLPDGHDHAARVVRAPVSALPCYYTTVQNVTVVFSRLADCAALTQTPFTVDWQQLAIRLATNLDRVQTSVLKEVSTVYPGECITLRSGRAERAFYWHPETVSTTDVLEDLPSATNAIQNAGSHCIAAWAGCYEAVIHLLSGGFDSSVVAALMRQAVPSPQVVCLNFRASDHASDERHYARTVAQQLGYRMIEAVRPLDVQLDEALRAHPHVTPGNPIESLELNPVLRQIAQESGAQAVFNGQHGDSIFYNNQVRLAAIDLARRHGLTRVLFELLATIRMRSQVSFFTLLCETLVTGYFRGRWNARRHLLDLTTNTLIPAHVHRVALNSTDTLGPWFCGGSALTPGKLFHAWLLFAPTTFYDQFQLPTDPERTEPLLSQPLVDVCLRIPTYVHAYNGQRRAAARLAFSPHIPPEITHRHWKSAMGQHMRDVLENNLEFSRQLLLDGALIKEGLLDRGRVENALELSRTSAKTSDILEAISAESWYATLSSMNARAKGWSQIMRDGVPVHSVTPLSANVGF